MQRVRQRLDGLQEKKANTSGSRAELGFATREIADLAARAEKQRALIKGLDSDAQKKAELIAKVRAGLGAGRRSRRTGSKRASVTGSRRSTQRTGTLAARLEHYKEEREKILADQKTIREPGADGTCPLCRQKLGEHFGSIEAEFRQNCRNWTKRQSPISNGRRSSAKRRPSVESLKPVLDQVRTLQRNSGRSPCMKRNWPTLRQSTQRRRQEQQAITESIAKLGLQ